MYHNIKRWKELLKINLTKSPFQQYALLSTEETFYKVHSEQINVIHEHIILTHLDASDNSIPLLKCFDP